METQEMLPFHQQRVDAILKKEISETLKYENGITFHSIPHVLLNNKPVDWSVKNQANCPKNAFRRFSDFQITFNPISDGYLGATDSEYTIWFDNGIIETFSSPLIKQTQIPNAPIVNFIEVESILMHAKNFMIAFLDVYNNCYNIKPPYSLFISLIGVQNIFFNARERNYTTTLPCLNNIYTFPTINYKHNDNNEFWKQMLETIHSSLVQLNAVR